MDNLLTTSTNEHPRPSIRSLHFVSMSLIQYAFQVKGRAVFALFSAQNQFFANFSVSAIKNLADNESETINRHYHLIRKLCPK